MTREFVRSCQTPTLVLPDDIPPHPYAVAMEIVSLAPNAEASIYPRKESKDTIEKVVEHVQTFLKAHEPVAARQPGARSSGTGRSLQSGDVTPADRTDPAARPSAGAICPGQTKFCLTGPFLRRNE